MMFASFHHSQTRRTQLQNSRQAVYRALFESLESRRLLSFSPAATYAVGMSPQAVVTADFNNDGRLDLATADSGGNAVSVLLGDGQGGFGAASHFAAGSGPRALVVSDFNNDGKFDLAAANDNSPGNNDVSILLGNGDGTFRPPVSAGGWFGEAFSLAPADFNADGKMDLVYTFLDISDFDAVYVQVLLGDGLGGFTFGEYEYVNSISPLGVAVADLNADGKVDVVKTDDYTNAVAVLLGNGDGTLSYDYSSSSSNFATGPSPQAVAVGDFTGDGIPDLVVAGQIVDVLPGHGDGTFASPIPHSANGSAHTAVATGDFNGDGKLDLVTSDGAAGSVSTLLGNGDGNLSYVGAFATGSSPAAVAGGDFNADGRPDVAAANGGANAIAVLLNDGNWAGNKTFVGPGGAGSGGNWSNAGNWSPAGVPAATDHVAISGKSVNLGSSATVASLALTGGAALSIGSNGSRVLRTNSLTISGSGSKLDLKDNDLIVDYAGASPAAGVEALVRSGYNGSGNWLGQGITSGVAAADGNFTLAVADNALLPAPFGTAQGGPLFAGVDVDLDTILVKFTHRADINLDGVITPDDSAIFGGNFDESITSGFTWAQGDMNYDGACTPDDAAIFGGAYDESLTSLPEPGMMPLALATLALSGGRRRRR